MKKPFCLFLIEKNKELHKALLFFLQIDLVLLFLAFAEPPQFLTLEHSLY